MPALSSLTPATIRAVCARVRRGERAFIVVMVLGLVALAALLWWTVFVYIENPLIATMAVALAFVTFVPPAVSLFRR